MIQNMLQKGREALCYLFGHPLEVFDTDLYGPMLVCRRCLGNFQYDPAEWDGEDE